MCTDYSQLNETKTTINNSVTSDKHNSTFITCLYCCSNDEIGEAGQALAVHPDVDSSVFVEVIFYILLFNIIMYLILIINHNLILCDHED